MTTAEKIQPAITAEEWGIALMRRANIATGKANAPDHHALAALALYEKPYGFTAEDVELLGSVSDRLSQEWMGGGPHPFEVRIGALMDRIAALLPPE